MAFGDRSTDENNERIKEKEKEGTELVHLKSSGKTIELTHSSRIVLSRGKNWSLSLKITTFGGGRG